MGCSCHLCCFCSNFMFFKRSRVYCSKSAYAHQTSQKKLVPGLVIQIIPVLQECTTILQLKVYIVKRCLDTHLSRSVLSTWLYSFFNLLQTRSPDHQFFLFFIHEVSHHKVRNVMDSSFWKKVQMGLAWSV